MRRLFAPLLLIALLLAACGSAGSFAPEGITDNGGAPAMPQPGVVDRDAGGGSDGTTGNTGYETGPDGAPVDSERQIIRAGSISLEVDDVDATADEVRELAADLDGYVSGAQMGGRGESGQLTLRVPAEHFDAAVSALRGMGEQLSFTVTEDDVTTELIDLEARLKNLRAAEESYRVLLDEAVNVEEVLMVQARLDEIRGQIESLDGQRAYLQRQADMATLAVTLSTPAQPISEQTDDFDPGRVASEALAGLLGLGQTALTMLIYLAILGVPLALLASVVLVPLWLFRRRRTRTAPRNQDKKPAA